jgi:hypothetical protein
MKQLDPKEFQRLGFLQEVNRLWLHPIGLALGVQTDELTGISSLFVWDCRDDPEGIYFSDTLIDTDEARAKAKHVEDAWLAKRDARVTMFNGTHIQRVPGHDD